MKNNRLNILWNLIESKEINFSITPEYIESIYFNLKSNRFGTDDNLYSTVGALYYYMDKDIEYVQSFLDKLSAKGQTIIDYFINKYGLFVNVTELRNRLLENISDESFELVFPIPVYVSGSKDDKMTIGLLYHEDGNIEMFEGNDEATEETIKKVNRIFGGKKIRIYGSHNQKVVNTIVTSNMLPKNLYISPNREYASGYFGSDRVVFSAVVDTSYINQESEYDWKTIEDTPIEKLTIL
jgi:hypothetical protein